MDENSQRLHIERLTAAIEKTYHNPRVLIWRGFLIGLASGLGATIGVAIVLALLGLFVREFGGLPVIGQWLQGLNSSINDYSF